MTNPIQLKEISVFLLALLIFKNSYGQTKKEIYNQNIVSFRIYLNKKDTNNALIYLNKLKQINYGYFKNYQFIDLVDILIAKKRYNDAEKEIIIGILNGVDIDRLESISITEGFNNRFKNILTKYNNLNLIFLSKGRNLIKSQFVLELLTADNAQRSFTTLYGNQTYNSEIIKSDSIRFNDLVLFSKKYGFPKISEISTYNMFEVIYHHLLRYSKHPYYSYLDSTVKINALSCEAVSEMYVWNKEQDKISKTGKSIYGFFKEPIENINTVDSLRISVGLLSIYEEHLAFGKVLPKEYKPSSYIVNKYSKLLK